MKRRRLITARGAICQDGMHERPLRSDQNTAFLITRALVFDVHQLTLMGLLDWRNIPPLSQSICDNLSFQLKPMERRRAPTVAGS